MKLAYKISDFFIVHPYKFFIFLKCDIYVYTDIVIIPYHRCWWYVPFVVFGSHIQMIVYIASNINRNIFNYLQSVTHKAYVLLDCLSWVSFMTPKSRSTGCPLHNRVHPFWNPVPNWLPQCCVPFPKFVSFKFIQQSYSTSFPIPYIQLHLCLGLNHFHRSMQLWPTVAAARPKYIARNAWWVYMHKHSFIGFPTAFY